jgi:hypothetical protein
MEVSSATVEISIEFPQKKKKIELPYDPPIPLCGYTQRKQSQLSTDTCTPMFIMTLVTIANLWNQPECPSMDDWIRKI